MGSRVFRSAIGCAWMVRESLERGKKSSAISYCVSEALSPLPPCPQPHGPVRAYRNKSCCSALARSRCNEVADGRGGKRSTGFEAPDRVCLMDRKSRYTEYYAMLLYAPVGKSIRDRTLNSSLSGVQRLQLYYVMYTYMYVCMYMCVRIYIYIYVRGTAGF